MPTPTSGSTGTAPSTSCGAKANARSRSDRVGHDDATGKQADRTRVEVVGHVEWVEFASVPRLPRAGEVVLARSSTAPHRQVQRAQALLLAAAGEANSRIAEQVGVTVVTVRAWRVRFQEAGLGDLGVVRAGRGRKALIPAEKVEAIVHATLDEKPPGQTHWSCRAMATRCGVSPATVQRIWSARGLQPHRVETFKLSDDKRFEEKLVDVVGLYLNPPEKAVVLCLDEKVRHEALSDSSGVQDPDAGPPQRPGGS